ncbi:hypothetical protein WJX82_009486 [Trebouxia sp. C0006]
MFDRQRSSKPQMPRKVASKVREELEVDAAEKEARLAELRSTMSKQKQEIDKLISQRGPTLWTSSSEIRASPGTRQALPTKSLAAKAKGGVLTEASLLKQATQQTLKKVDSGSILHGAQSKVPGKPGPFMAAQTDAVKESSSYRPSPTRRLSNAPSGKTTGPLGSNQLGIKPSLQKAANPKAASASSSLNCSSSGKAVPSSPGGGISRAGSGAISSTTMTGGGMRQSSSGTANISDDPANSSSGISSISGGVAAASNGSRGGMAVQTDGSGDSNGSRGGLAVQADGSGGSNGSRGGMALQTDGGGGSNACISSTARQGGAQANATALPVDKPKLPVKAFHGPSLLDGDFNEDDSHASFADALSSWRGKAPAQAPTTTGPNAAPGTITQAGARTIATALAAAASPPKQTYFERLLWNQASQEAAAAVAGKPVRSFADDKEAALQSVLEEQNRVSDS